MEHKILNIGLALSAMAILFLSLFSPSKAYGYDDSHVEDKLSVDKKLRAIEDSSYVDNIESSTKTFFENNVVEFQINVKNIWTDPVYNINIKDTLPKYLSLIFYPGKFDSDQYIVEWDIDKLDPGETKTYLIRAKISNSQKLNVTNKQTNKAEACGGGYCDSDHASYFIGNVVIPATGVSDILLKTGLVASATGLGFWLRKKSRGY